MGCSMARSELERLEAVNQMGKRIGGLTRLDPFRVVMVASGASQSAVAAV